MTPTITDGLASAGTALPAAIPALLMLLKATCLLLVALGASILMQRASAGARHLVWLVALGALIVLPALAAWSPLQMPVLPEARTVAEPTSPAPASTPLAGGTVTDASSATIAPETNLSSGAKLQPSGFLDGRPLSLGVALLVIWGVIALALIARLAYGVLSVRRIVRRARPLEHPDWQTPLYEIADRLGLDAAPRLLRSEDVKMPFASGLVASTIVLPAESDEWSAERRSAVLIHELGHVRRRDLIGHTLGRVACALYWFHPLVWTAARRLRVESERACDDLALVFGARPSDYAEHLLDIVTCVRDHNTPSVALAMAQRKEFEGRMLAILNPELRRLGPTRLQRASLVGLLALLALVVGAASPVARSAPPQDAVLPEPASNPAFFADTAANPAPRRSALPTPLPVPSPQPSTKGPANVPVSAPEQDPSDERWALLAKALRTDSSVAVRRVAAWGLQRYARTEGAVEALIAAVGSDADASVREMSVWALSQARGNTATTAALMKAVRQDRDSEVRATAVWALGSIGDEDAVETLVTVLGHTDPKLREVAAWAIGSCGPAQAPAELVSALSDRDRNVRKSVAWALYTIGDASTVPAIDAALRRETDSVVQRDLIRSLATMGEPAVDALQRLVTSPDTEIRTIAVTALAGRGSGPWVWPWPRPNPRPFP